MHTPPRNPDEAMKKLKSELNPSEEYGDGEKVPESEDNDMTGSEADLKTHKEMKRELGTKEHEQDCWG